MTDQDPATSASLSACRTGNQLRAIHLERGIVVPRESESLIQPRLR
jgi:hypothetical protein